MKRSLLPVLIACLLLTFGQAFSQEVKMLSLKEAIDLSIKNSKQLRSSRAKIDEATAQVTEALESRLPGLSVTGSYLYLPIKPTVDLKVKSSSSSSGGGTTTNESPKVSQATYGMATLNLPLYAGGRIKYGIESAKYLQQAALLDADNDREAVEFNTIDAFINLYKANAAIDVLKENLQQSLKRDTDFIRLENNGLLARNDRLKAQLQTSNIELTLLDAENNRNLANVNMNLMLGLPENTVLRPDSSDLQGTLAIKNIDEYETLALQNRKDVQALSLRKKAAATAIKSANAEQYPTIGLTGGYVAAYVPNVLTITNAVNVGVGVQYNLGSLWKTNTKLQQAKAKEEGIKANEEVLGDAVRLQVNRDYKNYLLTQQKITVYTRSLEQAAENYRITNNKYANSLVTTTDLLEADVAQMQARLNLAFAKADALGAYNKLLQTAGLLTITNQYK